jgi:diazepam-binding inhibitor (GABA receptor modulating acyl-CoA-binding protein)
MRMRTLSTTELKEVFKSALEFVRPFLSMSAADLAKPGVTAVPLVLTDAEKLQFYGYFKQATKGDIPLDSARAADPVEAAKTDAWTTVRGLGRRDAMRAFVYLLYQALPTWEPSVPLADTAAPVSN